MTITTEHCANCAKPLDGKLSNRVGIQTGAEPETIITLCDKCARRFMHNVVRIEKQQQGVLAA